MIHRSLLATLTLILSASAAIAQPGLDRRLGLQPGESRHMMENAQRAERQRAEAVAREQEMRARVEENRAKVVEAEAQVPLAIAQAFRDGRIGIMEFYNMRNLQSDTEMRNAIAGATVNERNLRPGT